MAGTSPANALVLGIDTPVGAYLARLLQMRGTAVFGVGGTAALAALASLDAVNVVAAGDAAGLAATLGELTVFAINDDRPVQQALAAELLAAAAPARLCHVVDAGILARSPALLAQAKSVAALRRDAGRHAINVILHAHDSRLGTPGTMPARIVEAAWRAAQGDPTPGREIAETGPQDWGWTAEYVDAVARAAALDHPIDLAVGSGHLLTTAEFVTHAFEYFKREPAPHVRILPGEAKPAAPIDTTRLKAATGWSATTWGRDLVRALCEGAASRFR